MATQPAMSMLEQYLNTSYSLDVDFVDGSIEERSSGDFDNARLQAQLSAIVVLGDYLHMGLEQLRLLDPMRRVAYTFSQHGLQENEDPWIAPGTGIQLDVDSLPLRLD